MASSVQNLGILIEAKTAGQEAVRNLEERINSLFKRLEDSGATEVLRRGIQAAESALIAGAVAAVKHQTAIQNTVDAYRGARLAMAALEGTSRLYFAGATVGAGILIEKLVSVAGAYSKVLEGQARAAAAAQKSVTDVERAANISIITGADFNPAANFNAEQIRAGVEELRRIPDAYARAQRAQLLFGADSQEVLNRLQGRIVQNVEAAENLSTALGQEARESIQRFRDDLDSFRNFNPFAGVMESLRALRIEARQGITVRVAAAFDFGRGLSSRLPSPGGDFAGGEGGPGISAGPPRPTPAELLSQLQASLRFPTTAPPDFALSRRGTSADVLRANRILSDAGSSLEGARRELERANRDYQDALRRYDTNRGGEQEAFDLRVAAEEKTKWERRTKIFEEANDAAQRAKEIRRGLIQQIAGIQAERLPAELQVVASRNAQIEQIRAESALTQDIKNLLESQAFAQLSNLTAAAVDTFPLGRPQSLNQQIADRLTGIDNALRSVLNAGQFGTQQDILQSLFPLAGTSATSTASLIGLLGRGFTQQSDINRQASLDQIRRNADFQARTIQALARPGDEVAAINRIADIRITAAEREAAIFRDTAREREALADLEARAAEIQLQRATDLLNIDRQRREQFRDAIGSVFDASIAGREGLRGFLSSTFRANARVATQNAGELLFSNVAGRLALPGQGTAENPTALGRILSGTIFQRNPLEGQLDINTVATQANTAATAALTRVMSFGGGVPGLDVAGAGAGSIVLPGGLSIPSGVFQGAGRGGLIYSLAEGAATGQSLFSSFAGSTVRDPFKGQVPDSVRASARNDFYRDVLGIDPGVQTVAKATSSNLAKGLGVVASLGAAGFGVAAGVREGGLRGATTATASGLGGLASILTIAGVSGPAAPIVAGAALGLTYARLLFPDPKKQREDFINAQLDAARFQAPAATSYGVGVDGFGVDTNKAGAVRPIVINIQALDIKSITDRRGDIADAVRYAIQEGHAINGEMREALA